MSRQIKGIDASPGIAIGKVFLYHEKELVIEERKNCDPEKEKEKLLAGREKSKEQLLVIRDKTAKKLGEDKAAIFDGHITLLEDEDLFDEVIEIIKKERTLFPVEEKIGSGPAKYFKSHFSKGKIGFITPLSHNFCDKCNRIRLTPDGFLKLCLHWNKGIDLKNIIRNKATDEELEKIIFNAIYNKPEHHSMDKNIEENSIDKRKMNQIGG